MNILKELLELKELGVNTVTSKEPKNANVFAGGLQTKHGFLTQPLKKYKIKIFLDTTQDELEGKIKNAKQYLEDRRNYQVIPPHLVEIFDTFKPS